MPLENTVKFKIDTMRKYYSWGFHQIYRYIVPFNLIVQHILESKLIGGGAMQVTVYWLRLMAEARKDTTSYKS